MLKTAWSCDPDRNPVPSVLGFPDEDGSGWLGRAIVLVLASCHKVSVACLPSGRLSVLVSTCLGLSMTRAASTWPLGGAGTGPHLPQLGALAGARGHAHSQAGRSGASAHVDLGTHNPNLALLLLSVVLDFGVLWISGNPNCFHEAETPLFAGNSQKLHDSRSFSLQV